MKNFLKIFSTITTNFLNILISCVYFVIAAIIIFIIAYVFGHPILDGPNLVGNDSLFALSLVHWFGKFFPTLPVWYPLQNMGISLLYSYSFNATLWIILLKSLTSLSVIEIFRYISFLEFPLTAIGIFLFCWFRLRNQTIGLIAAVFYLISQASWLLQVLHGIFAQSVSIMLIAPSFIVFDIYIEHILKHGYKKVTGRLYLVIVVFVLGILFFAHFVAGIITSLAFVLWSVLRHIMIDWQSLRAKTFFIRVFQGIFRSLIIVILAQTLMAFWAFPYNSYNGLANREGLNTRDVQSLQQESLRIPSLLGFGTLSEGDYRYDFFFFATPVIIFFIVGTISAFALRNRKLIIFSIISIVFTFLSSLPIYLPALAGAFKIIFTAINFRALLPVFILMPVVAAWGIWSIPYALLLAPFKKLTKKLMAKKNIFIRAPVYLSNLLLFITVSIVSLIIAWWAIGAFQHAPPQLKEKRQYEAYGPSISKDYHSFLADPQGFLSQNHSIKINKEGIGGATMILDSLNKNLKPEKDTIIDVSPFAAGGIIMQSIGLTDTNFRTINLYHYYASLIHGMWGYQAGVFFGKEPLYKSSHLLGELSDWFGIKYALVVPGFDPFYKYKDNGWFPLTDYSNTTRNWGFEVWENPDPKGLYTVSNRPVVLAIGNYEKGFYDHVFRAANLGALSYKDAWIVEGKKNIDDYSFDQLQEFDGLILHGYSYKFWDKSGAWDMIRRYVEQGGNVFVDTGWQYVSADWNGSLPEPLPVKQAGWSNIGTTWDGVSLNGNFSAGADINTFDPPVWDGAPWGMSISKSGFMRDNSQAIISKEDSVLMAYRQFGKGKIVWSGMNLLTHTTGKMNESEAKFLGTVFAKLFIKNNFNDYNKLSLQRENPDSVKITFSTANNNPGWLLFRESYAPYWHARFTSGGSQEDLPTYRSGPGFVLVKIPQIQPGDVLNLDVRLNFFDGIFAKIISLITVAGLLLYIIFGGLIFHPARLILSHKIFHSIKHKMKKEIESFTKGEEDY